MTSGGRKRKASVRFLVCPPHPPSPSSVSFGIHVAGRVSAFTVALNVQATARHACVCVCEAIGIWKNGVGPRQGLTPLLSFFYCPPSWPALCHFPQNPPLALILPGLSPQKCLIDKGCESLYCRAVTNKKRPTGKGIICSSYKDAGVLCVGGAGDCHHCVTSWGCRDNEHGAYTCAYLLLLQL